MTKDAAYGDHIALLDASADYVRGEITHNTRVNRLLGELTAAREKTWATFLGLEGPVTNDVLVSVLTEEQGVLTELSQAYIDRAEFIKEADLRKWVRK